MEILNDGIHNCKECETYKKYGEVCSSSPELKVEACEFCDTRMCCRQPFLALLPCEMNSILSKVEEGEYVEFKGIVPFNIETGYCKHMDLGTMNCKVYEVRPIACRIAGHSCKGEFWVKHLKEVHERNKSGK